MLIPITAYTLAEHDGPYASWPLTTPLLCDGVPTGQRVPGFVIEGQYRWNDYVLLINSWDCPFEESYDFLLLNDRHEIVARTSLGGPYITYLLHTHWPESANSVRLLFSGDSIMTLHITPRTRWWHRKLRLTLERHLITPTDARTREAIRELQDRLLAIAGRE